MTPVVSVQAVAEELSILADEITIYLNKQTGKFVMVSQDELSLLAEEGAEDAEDGNELAAVVDSDDYIQLPTQFDVHEWEIMRQFCDQVDDEPLRHELLNAIHGRGAFRHFKDTLHRHNIQQRWYAFHKAALEEIAERWLQENEIPYSNETAAPKTMAAATMPSSPLPAKATLTICFAHVAYQMATCFVARQTNIHHFEVRTVEDLAAQIGGADVLVVSGLWRNSLLDHAPRLKFIQSIGAGVDQFPQEELRRRGIRLASARGVNRNAVSEHAMAHMLAFVRHIHTGRDNQHKHFWRGMLGDLTQREDELGGKTLLIVGIGGIGARLAQLAKAFDMHVIATKRNPASGAGVADEIYTPDQLPELLPRADFVTLTCPLTPETAKIIDARALALMKRSAYLINMARGRCVDEAALIDALQRGAIAGAGLDCAWEEPLAPDSPLWDLPQVIITPHTAGETRRYEENVIAILLENLNCLWQGESSLHNQVV